MSAIDTMAATDQIGEAAGWVWQLLHTNGPTKMAQIVKDIDAPRDQVMQAIGWLAREGKISIETQSRSRIVTLTR